MFLGFILISTMKVFLSIFACVLLDFWIVKNVTGRYLVGMRWWSVIDSKGRTNYSFESYDYDIKHSHTDTTVFYWGLGIITVYWGIMCIINLFGLNLLYVINFQQNL